MDGEATEAEAEAKAEAEAETEEAFVSGGERRLPGWKYPPPPPSSSLPSMKSGWASWCTFIGNLSDLWKYLRL